MQLSRQYKSIILIIVLFVFIISIFFIFRFYKNRGIYYATLGHNHYENNRYEAALKCYKKAMSLGHTSTYMSNNLGFIYHYEKKDYEKAKGMFNNSLCLNPKDSWAHYSLSQLYLDMDDLENGVKEYSRYIKYSSHKKISINVNKVKEILHRRGENEESVIRFLNTINNINPDDCLVLNEIAKYDMKNKRFTEALKKYEKILEIKNNWGEAYVGLGSCYYNLGDEKKSFESFKKAQDLGTYVPEIFLKK